jgi:putative intracellular protease/amidase
MPGKKMLMLTGEFTEEYEIYVYQQAMEAVRHTVHVVCPDKQAGDLIKTSLHDFEGDQIYTEKLGHFFTINKTFPKPRRNASGGTYVDLSPTEGLVDGTMVSAKGWTALAGFIRQCLKVLGTEIRHRDDIAGAS